MPSGTSWNLRPVTIDADGQPVLAAGRWVAGHHVITLPDAVRLEVVDAARDVVGRDLAVAVDADDHVAARARDRGIQPGGHDPAGI